jgi:hypothetical protein
MAGKPAVQVTGAVEFRAAMKRMGADLSDLTKIHREAAKPVLETSRSIVPRVSGTLAGSLRISATKASAKVLSGSAAVPYAGPIHFGWPARNIRPQPFLYDALDQRADEVVEKYEAHIEALVEKVAAETPP